MWRYRKVPEDKFYNLLFGLSSLFLLQGPLSSVGIRIVGGTLADR